MVNVDHQRSWSWLSYEFKRDFLWIEDEASMIAGSGDYKFNNRDMGLNVRWREIMLQVNFPIIRFWSCIHITRMGQTGMKQYYSEQEMNSTRI